MEDVEQLGGIVEVDETFVGGKVGLMKRDARERKGITKRGGGSSRRSADAARDRRAHYFRQRQNGPCR